MFFLYKKMLSIRFIFTEQLNWWLSNKLLSHVRWPPWRLPTATTCFVRAYCLPRKLCCKEYVFSCRHQKLRSRCVVIRRHLNYWCINTSPRDLFRQQQETTFISLVTSHERRKIIDCSSHINAWPLLLCASLDIDIKLLFTCTVKEFQLSSFAFGRNDS